MNISRVGPDISKLVEVAEEAAVVAGNVAHEIISQPRRIEMKGFRDIVTDADLSVQAAIAEIILHHFPDHGFLTEETDVSLPTSGPIIWIIDPIDGTTNYSRQIPVYSVSVAAAAQVPQVAPSIDHHLGELLSGAIFDPERKELFSGGLGLGSRLRKLPAEIEQILSVSNRENLDTALAGLDFARSYALRTSMFQNLGNFMHSVRSVRAMGSAALGLAWVAAGRLDLYYNSRIGPWDVAAAKVILTEAGGQVTNLDGANWLPGDAGCVASNKLLHKKFIELIENNTGN